MVAAAGAGPKPIPFKALTVETLSKAISFCLTPAAAVAAKGIAEKMKAESGVRAAVKSFHDNLPLDSMQCDLFPDQPAVWEYRKRSKKIKLSKLAVDVLAQQSTIEKTRLLV